MKIAALLNELKRNNVDFDLRGSVEDEVLHLDCDSRSVTSGSMFFALRGTHFDGHAYIPQVVAAGAVAVVVDTVVEVEAAACVIRVTDVRQAMAYVARGFYSHPQQGMFIAAVTGTNGKTTLTYMLEALLRMKGKNPAVVGTISNRMDGKELEASHTTPDSLGLYQLLADFKANGANALALEVSSHALEQQRVLGLDIDLGVFTNLTPEHLDYHLDMERYYTAKARLFSAAAGYGCRRAVINIADPYGERLAAEIPEALCVDPRVGATSHADIRVSRATYELDGISAEIHTPDGDVEIHSPLIGPFNLENLCCAMGAGVAMGLSIQDTAECLAQVLPIPGRLERVENTLGALVLVDYAHTSDALEKALEAVIALNPRRLITVVGCGGDRDKSKRPLMAATAVRASALTLITSDNPRTEDPHAIIQDMLAGLKNSAAQELTPVAVKQGQEGYCVVEDRAVALKLAAEVLQAGDVLLAVGKGHEDYQIIGTTKHHFDDREHLHAALKKRAAAV
ncbi:MAG: UDP-N-acetylmuramoyl-L-alanyl-D-glutamate--2,6-diaminopimelate ligase [Desulfuromonadaceae bacterium]|nr:UDP-N-acetylmuramoyl-L-alanyl-D-glutamate--2,6-diaminopimelate ligase [Desulfuromonadaceae bacterium]